MIKIGLKVLQNLKKSWYKPREIILEGGIKASELNKVAPFANHLLKSPTVEDLTTNAIKIKEKLSLIDNEWYSFWKSNLDDTPYFLEIKKCYEYPKFLKSKQIKSLKNAHPSNLTNELKSHFYTPDEVREVLENNPNLSPIVGSLPQKWGRIFKSKEKLEEIDNIFFNASSNFYYRNEIKISDLDKLKESLTKALGREVNVEFLGEGEIGRTFKITVGDEAYVLKCFKYRSGGLCGKYESPYEMEMGHHGNYWELCSALYATKNSPSNFVKFYMGRFDSAGYILTKFEPKKDLSHSIKRHIALNNQHDVPVFKFKDYLKRMISEDFNAANFNGDKSWDFGGTIPTIANNLSVQEKKLANQIADAIDSNNIEQLQLILKNNKNNTALCNVRDWFQMIINTKAKPSIVENQLHRKREILSMIGVDWTPQEGYLLESGSTYPWFHGLKIYDVKRGKSKTQYPLIDQKYGLEFKGNCLLTSEYYEKFKYNQNS